MWTRRRFIQTDAGLEGAGRSAFGFWCGSLTACLMAGFAIRRTASRFIATNRSILTLRNQTAFGFVKLDIVRNVVVLRVVMHRDQVDIVKTGQTLVVGELRQVWAAQFRVAGG